MNQLSSRRYTKLYERILLSKILSFICGWLLTVVLPATIYWGRPFWENQNTGRLTALSLASLCLLLSYLSISRTVNNYPGGQSMGLVLTHVLIIYLLGALATLLLHLDVSRYLLISSTLISVFWFIAEHLLTKKYRRAKIAIIPGGIANELVPLSEIDGRVLYKLDLENVRYDAVVADFNELNQECQRFITNCALKGIVIYDARAVYEAITGRVRLNRMTDNNLGSLLPTNSYKAIKTTFDISLVILFSPVILVLIVLIGICIHIDSNGPIFFKQRRVGQGKKPFVIYKFRSMRAESCTKDSALFAQAGDLRITRVGRVIRKIRLDELPQLFNVLKGDMAIIGPRPEQPEFVEQFDSNLPFYSYRHVIKPGITGWAQVHQGYVANEDETKEKIEYDFYYIKHASIYLDIYIILLTARTVLTGFGAR